MIIIGIILFAIGLIIRLIAIRTLKKRFSFYLISQENLQTTGIYSKVRHPSYTGSMLMLFGLSFISLQFCFCYLTFIFFLSRASQEEQIMSANPEYINYLIKTKRFIPYII